MRVLCAGDLHLGRRSSRLPSHVDPRGVSAAATWAAIVDYAIAQRAEVVALSGDLVDQANRYYESLGPLERGLRRLAEAGITTVAVAGNHDHAVLPELARSLPAGHLRLLGVGGTWERTTIAGRDGAALHVDGWSFPTQHVRDNPLASYDLPAMADAPVLGLLHTDLDQPSSAYAPVSLGDLRARPVSMWLLGHVHVPSLRAGAGVAPVLYPGSPQPLDPGEPGAHGAWLVELAPGAPLAPRPVPVASVRYESLAVDVGAATDLEELRRLAVDGVRTAADALSADGGALRHLSLRLRLTGRCALHRELAREGAMMAAELALEVNGVGVSVERVEVATRPDRDLAALAAGGDAVSYIARLLVALERGEERAHYGELLRAVGAIPGTLQAAKPYRTLPSDEEELGPAALRVQLAREADLLLDELLAQKAAVA